MRSPLFSSPAIIRHRHLVETMIELSFIISTRKYLFNFAVVVIRERS